MLVGVSGLNHISSSRGPPKKLMPDSLTGSSTNRDWSKFQRQSVKPEKARHRLAAGKYRAAHGTDSTAQHSRLHLQTKHLGWTELEAFFPRSTRLPGSRRPTAADTYRDIRRHCQNPRRDRQDNTCPARRAAVRHPILFSPIPIAPSLSDVRNGTRSPPSLFFAFPPRSPCTRPIDRGAPRWARMLATAWEEAWRWGP